MTATQQQQEVNSLESQLITQLEIATKAGNDEAQSLLQAVRDYNIAVAATVYKRDYEDLANEENEGYRPLFNRYRLENQEHRYKQQDAQRQATQFSETKLAAESLMATLEDKKESAEEQLNHNE